MKRILTKQMVFYLVLVVAAVILASLTFFTWRDGKSLSAATDVSQEKVAIPADGLAGLPGQSSLAAPKHKPTKRWPNNIQRAEIKDTRTQVDTQKVLSNLIKYEGLFEKATDLEVNDENIIQTGE